MTLATHSETTPDDGSQYPSLSGDIQKAIDSVTNNAPAPNQANRKPDVNMSNMHNSPSAKKDHDYPDTNNGRWVPIANFWVQVALCVFTAGAFGAAMYYAGIAADQQSDMEGQWAVMLSQWMTMRDALLETQKQTSSAEESSKAAKIAANSAVEQIRLQKELARLSYHAANIKSNYFVAAHEVRSIWVSLVVQNDGVMDAKKTAVSCHIGFRNPSVAERGAFRQKDFVDVAPALIPPFIPTQRDHLDSENKTLGRTARLALRQFSQLQYDSLKDSPDMLYAWGLIRFTDLSGTDGILEFCSSAPIREILKVPSWDPVKGAAYGGPWKECPATP